MVDAAADLRGINHLFTFFALPGPVTCFEGVQSLLPGHYLRIQLGGPGEPAQVSEHTYWEIDFPDRGQEDPGELPKRLVDEFEAVLLGAVERRLRADVPVVSYLTGGVDSSMVVALASKVRGSPIPTFTIRIKDPSLDETSEAAVVARHVGTEPIVVGCRRRRGARTPTRELIRAAEGPVVDTSCAALLLLAHEVHARGYKVALTGEGADEWLAGYPWYKVNSCSACSTSFPACRSVQWLRRAFLRLTGPAATFPWRHAADLEELVGGHNGWLDIYGLMSLSKLRFFSRKLYEELGRPRRPTRTWAEPPTERLRRWHPLNRELYLGGRDPPARPAAQRQGRPRGDELLGRDALPVPRRGGVCASWRSCTRAGSCAACATSTCCGRWPSAGCRRRSPGGARPCSAPRSTASTSNRRRRSSTSC